MQNGQSFTAALTTDIDAGKIVAGAVVGAVVGGTLGAAAPALTTYGTVAVAQVQTTVVAAAAAHPTAAAAVGGLVETAVECSMTGGGCGAADYAVGALTAGVSHRLSTPHGNSKASTRPQHGYEIYELDSGNVVKTGISGQPLNQNGTSPRANQQVNAFNRDAGETVYGARVVVSNMPDRVTALQWERNNARQLWRNGNTMERHKLPVLE
jgi:hypothetical protein